MTKLLLVAALTLAPVAVSAQSQNWMYQSMPGGLRPMAYHGALIPQYRPPLDYGESAPAATPPPPINFYYLPSHPPMFSRPPAEDSDE